MPWETKTLLDLLGRVSNTQHLARPIKCCRSKFPQPYFRGRAVAFEAAAFAKMHPLRSGFILVGGFFLKKKKKRTRRRFSGKPRFFPWSTLKSLTRFF